ncbi:F-actin capping protein alpha subunit [Histomonas meleagridis]|uniref:F-actin capping protein alpha subunit n=1 Tax=Histomonas meleagridis TaxID=135588 RepID=UPI00355A9010|nr:F-actin capping protein alpha subunit [Histomonas meleagridis]KAH0803460.1 F-actin capping protein alpha subunit [Histomonas meleagridis]
MKQTQIISEILSEAPPGEYKQCEAALKGLLPKQNSLKEATEATELQWNLSQYTYVPFNTHSAMLCAEARLPDGSFIDPVTLQTFTYNLDKKAATNTGKTVQGSPLRNLIQEKISVYGLNSYGHYFACGAFDTKDQKVQVILRSSSISLENYRTGNVIAKYLVDPSKLEVKGRIQTLQHFFENGNAVCQYGVNLDKKLSGKSPEEISNSFMEAIIEFENNFYDEYIIGLSKIGDEGLNRLRRKLPVTATKINWEIELTTGASMQNQ